MFDKVDVALGDIAKMGPEVESSEGSNIEDDEEADKLDRDGSSKAYTKNNQPTEIECVDFLQPGDVNQISNSDNSIILSPPPLCRKALLGKVAKAYHGVEGGADEEDHDGVEEDVAVDDGEGGVEGEEHAGKARRREAGRQLPDGEEA